MWRYGVAETVGKYSYEKFLWQIYVPKPKRLKLTQAWRDSVRSKNKRANGIFDLKLDFIASDAKHARSRNIFPDYMRDFEQMEYFKILFWDTFSLDFFGRLHRNPSRLKRRFLKSVTSEKKMCRSYVWARHPPMTITFPPISKIFLRKTIREAAFKFFRHDGIK